MPAEKSPREELLAAIDAIRAKQPQQGANLLQDMIVRGVATREAFYFLAHCCS